MIFEIFDIILDVFIVVNFDMEDCAHGCTDGFGIESVDGGANDGEILVTKTYSGTDNGANIAGVGGVN